MSRQLAAGYLTPDSMFNCGVESRGCEDPQLPAWVNTIVAKPAKMPERNRPGDRND